MAIEARLAEVMSTRPCAFRLALQDDSVFADFDVDDNSQIYAVRISFDGYGCCRTTDAIGKMTSAHSFQLLDMVHQDELDIERLDEILRQYFEENKHIIWANALEDHGLLQDSAK